MTTVIIKSIKLQIFNVEASLVYRMYRTKRDNEQNSKKTIQQSSTDVPHRLLHSSVWCCRSLAPAICQPPSTDCFTCLLQHLLLSLLHFCWSYSLEFTAWQSAQLSCWARPVLTDSEIENPPVCLLLAFCWQCVRGVFYVFALYKCTFTYLLTVVSPWRQSDG